LRETRTAKEPERIPVVWKGIFEYVLPIPIPVVFTTDAPRSILASGKVQPVVFSEVLPLERVAEALSALENRKTWGKAVVRIRNEEDNVRQKAKL
jgi:NADPH2:quinone reductase